MKSNDSTLIIFRLRARRDELLAATSSEDHDHNSVELDQSRVGRLSRMDAMAQAEMAKASRALLQTELRRVEAAITRVENRTWGNCCRCQLPIDRDRLHADPATPFCFACFEEVEADRQSGAPRR